MVLGILRSEIDKIFTPFYQIESSHTREFGGAGLGLALAKELVELHGEVLNWKASPVPIPPSYYSLRLILLRYSPYASEVAISVYPAHRLDWHRGKVAPT